MAPWLIRPVDAQAGKAKIRTPAAICATMSSTPHTTNDTPIIRTDILFWIADSDRKRIKKTALGEVARSKNVFFDVHESHYMAK